MWSAIVVEVDSQSYGCDYFSDASENFAPEHFVLHCIVETFCLCIVFWIARLGHADTYTSLTKCVNVFTAGILTASVGVVNKIDDLAVNAFESHPQCLHRILRIKRGPDTPSNYLFAVCIQNHGQVAEVTLTIGPRYCDVSYITYPQLIGGCGDIAFYEVRIGWQTMCRVCRARLSDAKSNLEVVLINDAAEAVAPDWFVEAEVITVHMPQLKSSDARVFLADVTDVLKGKLLAGGLGMCCVFIVLVVSLLTYTKQLAETPDTVASGVLCVQVPYCLAPAFFLIGILNFASATSIILS